MHYTIQYISWVAPTGMIDRTTRFDGSSSYIVLPKDTCSSVRGLSQVTFTIIQVKGTENKIYIWKQ